MLTRLPTFGSVLRGCTSGEGGDGAVCPIANRAVEIPQPASTASVRMKSRRLGNGRHFQLRISRPPFRQTICPASFWINNNRRRSYPAARRPVKHRSQQIGINPGNRTNQARPRLPTGDAGVVGKDRAGVKTKVAGGRGGGRWAGP